MAYSKCLISISNYYYNQGACTDEDKAQREEKLAMEDHMERNTTKPWWLLFELSHIVVVLCVLLFQMSHE